MKKIIAGILLVFLIIFVGGFVITSTNNPFKIRNLVVLSGSMEPAIKTGSIIFIRPKNNYQIGDVISFYSGKQIFTHRIKEILSEQNTKQYLTKGDANGNNDTRPINHSDVLGSVIITLPFIGYLMSFSRSIAGLILFIFLPAAIIIALELINIVKEITKLNSGYRQVNIEWQKITTVLIIGLSILLFFTNRQVVLAYFSSLFIFPGNTITTGNIVISTTPTPTITPTVMLTPTPTGAVANHIVISEVQIDGGTGNANDYDFIELYNPTNLDKSLDGLRLIKRASDSATNTTVFTFNSSHDISSHGYFLWANNVYANLVSADASSAAKLASNNSVAIKGISTDNIIDALSWDSSVNSLREGTEFNPDPGVYQSIERKAYSSSTVGSMTSGEHVNNGNGYDSDNNANDFILRPTSQPQNSSSPTETP